MPIRKITGVLCAVLAAGTTGLAQTGPDQAASLHVPAPNTAAAPSHQSDPKFLSAVEDAKNLIRQRKLDFAVDAYRKANKIAEGRCGDCLHQQAVLLLEMHSYKDSAKAAAAWAALAETPLQRSIAEALQGEILFDQGGDKPKPAQLHAADEVLQAAIADYPANLRALFLDGSVRAWLGDIDAARGLFERAEPLASPKDPSYLRLKHFAENPELATHKMAPAFSVTALDGSQFNLDSMGGRVVLIDFWATWCGPCNEELPHIKRIARDFAGQPLVILSISWDSDEAKWKSFVAKNEMSWVQYRDADHGVSKLFAIDAIPHYFTIDSDGVLTAEMLGSGSDVEGKLKKLVARAKAAQQSPAQTAFIPAASVGASRAQ